MRNALLTLAMGAVLGFTLSRIGFSSWDEVHAMFVFKSLRMFLAFALAVVVLFFAFRAIASAAPRRAHFRARPIHRGTLVGSLLFGAGWALGGACPGIALVQLGEGQLAAGYTLLGMFAGNWLYGAVHARYLRWDTASCLNE